MPRPVHTRPVLIRTVPTRRMLATLVATAGLLFVLTGCSEPIPVAPSATPTASGVPAPTGDGLLRIGTMFPMTGEAAASGAAQVAGTEVAAREIAAQGGVLGQPVQLIHRNSAGDTAAAIADLTARGVDVVLWDAGSAAAAEAQASVAPAAFLSLSDLVNGGTPLETDEQLAQRLRVADPGLVATAGGAEAYDAVVATALAAAVTGDDGAASIETGWITVRGGSAVCTSWGECQLAISEAREIDYQGLTGRQS